ncbi:hypothetical protein AAG570_013590 [Ranatra chinensis]|uniref:Uncharacterized protein n=1 Tax=Ranatra chinensis TaxID=642074 RepID=A0ABD0YV58_9HEMI
MAYKRRNMFCENKKQETTKIASNMSRFTAVVFLVCALVAVSLAAPEGGKGTIEIKDTRGGGMHSQSGSVKYDWPISKDGNIRGGVYYTQERDKFAGGDWNRRNHGGLTISGRF